MIKIFGQIYMKYICMCYIFGPTYRAFIAINKKKKVYWRCLEISWDNNVLL